MKDIQNIFSARLADAMAVRKIKPAVLARTLETNPATVYRWLKGMVPQAKALRELEAVLGVRQGELCESDAGEIEDVADAPHPPLRLREESLDEWRSNEKLMEDLNNLCHRLLEESLPVVRNALKAAITETVNELATRSPRTNVSYRTPRTQ